MVASVVHRLVTIPQSGSTHQQNAPQIDDRDLSDQERAVLHTLLDQRGRVVTRTQLAQAVGLRREQGRRIDAYLVSVRRCLQESGLDMINVRSRGWMIP